MIALNGNKNKVVQYFSLCGQVNWIGDRGQACKSAISSLKLKKERHAFFGNMNYYNKKIASPPLFRLGRFIDRVFGGAG